MSLYYSIEIIEEGDRFMWRVIEDGTEYHCKVEIAYGFEKTAFDAFKKASFVRNGRTEMRGK